MELKESLLKKISPDKQAAVEPLIDQVLWFYGQNLAIDHTEDTLSRFVRDLQFRDEGLAPLPFGRIFLSEHGYPEESLVHELLHLAMPLRHGVYGFGFEIDDEPVKELLSLINNVIEHDLFLNDYLQLGYQLDRFLGDSSTLNMDYQKRIKEGGVNQVYWMHEYLRLSLTLRHLPENRATLCRKGIENVRKISLKSYPELQSFYQLIRAWINDKTFHVQGQYFQSVASLFKLMRIRQPIKFITPRGEQKIDVVYAHQLR